MMTATVMAAALLGNRLLRKATLRGIQWAVAALLVVVAALLGSGLL